MSQKKISRLDVEELVISLDFCRSFFNVCLHYFESLGVEASNKEDKPDKMILGVTPMSKLDSQTLRIALMGVSRELNIVSDSVADMFGD